MKIFRCEKCGVIAEFEDNRSSFDPKAMKCTCGGKVSLIPLEREEHEMTIMAYELGRDE